MNQTNGMKIVEEDFIEPFKEKYNRSVSVFREYAYYPFRIKVALFFIIVSLFFLVLDLFFLNESHGLIYWLNMALFFGFLGYGFYVGFTIEIVVKKYYNGVVYHYESRIFGLIPTITRKETKTIEKPLESEFKANTSRRESNKD